MSAVDNVAATSASGYQTIVVLVLFVAVMAVLPWLLRRWQRRQMEARGVQDVQAQVLSTAVLAPGQRIVVVEVGQGARSTRLVLGVTAQNIHCLHVLSDTAPGVPAAPVAEHTTFVSAMEQAQQLTERPH